MTIGEVVTKRRRELGLTLEDVGKRVGVTKATVLRWESGAIHNMKRDKIAALAAVLQLDPSVFVLPSEVLTEEEKTLLKTFRSLGHDGKRYLLQQAGIASALDSEMPLSPSSSK